MDNGKCGVAVVVVGLCAFIPFTLQAVGLFTPKWASNSDCSSIGLVYSCCSDEDNGTCANTRGGDELDANALGLQAASLTFMFLAMIVLCYVVCSLNFNDGAIEDSSNGRDCGIWLFFMMMILAGLCSIIGCIFVNTKYSWSDIGYSYWLCFASAWFNVVNGKRLSDRKSVSSNNA